MQGSELDDGERPIAKKDLHLVLAAWEKGAVVLSGDDRSRNLFARFADLESFGWARMTSDDIVAWLEAGAPASTVRLGPPT
jgi:hypothetical protein